MSKRTKLIVSSAVLLAVGAVCVISNIPSAPPRAIAVGQKIAVPPKFFDRVKVKNLEPMYEDRHSYCGKPDDTRKNQWTTGDRCRIGNENYGFELAVVALTDAEHVLLRYVPAGHDHWFSGDDLRCPQATLFLESPAWVSARMADYEAYVATRAVVASALAKEAITAPKPTVPAPKPEPPKPEPLVVKGQVIRVPAGFKETVLAQNPDGLVEQRLVSDNHKKSDTFDFIVRFGEKCVVSDDGRMNSYFYVVGTDGDDVMLRWEYPGWHMSGTDGRACPQKVLFFRATTWVKLRLAEEAAWRAKRSKVLKVLGK